MTQADPCPARLTVPTLHVTGGTPLLAAFASGAMVAAQQRINGDLGSLLDDPLLAAVVSFSVGLVVVSLLLATLPRSRARLRPLKDVPWWSMLGGLGGASMVAAGATAAPLIGVAPLTVGLVAGSTVGGLLVDRIGLGPGGMRPLTAPRMAGAVLCLAAIGVSAAGGVHGGRPLLLVLVVLAGALTSFQQAVNGRVRYATDALVATFVNFVVGTAGLLVGLGLHALLAGVHARAWPDLQHWHLYLGGPLGASFVFVAALTVRRLGVLRLALAVTAGQIIGAVPLDLGRGVALTTVVAAALTLVAVAISGRASRAPDAGPAGAVTG